MKKWFFTALAIVAVLTINLNPAAAQSKGLVYVEGGYIYAAAKIVEDMADNADPKLKKIGFRANLPVYVAYGEDRRDPVLLANFSDLEIDNGNFWCTKGAQPEWQAEKVGDYYRFSIPEGAEQYYVSLGKQVLRGFRFNFVQVNGEERAWSQIHKYEKELGKNYVYLGKFSPTKVDRNGLFVILPTK